jgi:hypothetical protein
MQVESEQSGLGDAAIPAAPAHDFAWTVVVVLLTRG